MRLDGRRIDNLPYEAMRRIRGKEIGAIFQDPLTSLNPLYTIGRQITETILTHLPVSQAEAQQRAIGLLREVGIPAAEKRIDHYPHQFSGGQRQRVAIGRALVRDVMDDDALHEVGVETVGLPLVEAGREMAELSVRASF